MILKFLHTRIKVGDLEKSIKFYEMLGFRCTERNDKSPAGNQLAFMTLPGNEHFLELTKTKDFIPQVPEDLVHTALGVPDLIEYCVELEKKGIAIWPNGWKEKFEKGEKKMAFITDPDGYEVELLEK